MFSPPRRTRATCLIIAPTLAAIEVALEVIGIPTATVSLPITGANLLQIGGQTTGSRPSAILVLGSGLDSSMYAANCASVLGTHLPIVPSFVASLISPLLILLLGIFLLRLGSLTPAQINTSHLILEL
jgi:hypothetical protein